ncbi:MAG: universal stress protein [Solirubrobacteraceae bacterium]
MSAAEGSPSAPDRPVIIAYDGSPAARRAIAAAAELLGHKRILVLTVWEAGLAYAAAQVPRDPMMMTPIVDPQLVAEVDHELHAHAETLAQDGAKLAVSLGLDAEPLAVADAGDVASTVLDLARERDAAAIVVGSRGHSGLRARLEGSTSKELLKHAPCAVIVVHDPEHA